jgi:hypothetical protein
MAVFTAVIGFVAKALVISTAAASAIVSISLTVASMAYQQSRMRKMRAELDKRKQVAVAVDGQPFYLGVVYGRANVSGGKTKHRLKDSYTHATAVGNSQTFATGLGGSQGGSKSEFLFVQQAVCYGGIEEVVDITVNDKNWNDETYNQQRIHFYKDGGVADPMATANGILSSNLFTNTAYASMCFKLNREEYNYNGSPNVTFFVKGMRIYDILFDGTNYSLSSTKTYSNNPARVLLDYLTSPVYGKGLDLSLIDLKTFYDAKVICDRVVNPSAAQDGRVNGRRPDVENEDGSITSSPPLANKEVRLYECNVVLDTERAIRENIELILESMEEAELVWSGGVYKLSLDAPTTELEQRALVVAELTDDDIINDQISLEFPDSSSRYNQAVVRFMNEFENFVDDTVTWPETYSTVYSQYLEEDSGILLKTEIYLPCTSDPYHAQAKAEQLVRTSRREMRVNFRVGKIGLSLEPGDIISVTSPSSGLNQELLKIEAVKLSQDLTAEISARQYDYNNFAWNVPDYIPYFSQKIDYYYKVVPPFNVVFTPDNGNGLFGVTSGRLTWSYPDTVSVSEFLIELSNDNGATWQTLTSTLTNVFDITGLNTGVYLFSVRSKDQSGRLSDRVIAENSEGTQSSFTIQRATADQVAVVYADTADELNNTQSYSLGTNTFVAYYVYSGDLPTLPITTGISFSKFVGADGLPGIDGIDAQDGNTVAQLQIFRRSSTALLPPTGGSYNFDTGVLAPPSDWSISVPAGTDPLYSSITIASIVGVSGTDSDLTWSNPSILAQNGLTGDPGKSVYTAIVFQRNSDTPTQAPTGGSFDFGTNTLTPPSGWFLDVPSGTNPIYGARFVFSITGDTGSQTATTWSTPFKIAEDGINGLDGISTFQISIYRRSATVPSPPTGGSYNFGTQVVTLPSGWSVSPLAGTDPLYISTTLASIQGVTGTDSTLSWSSPAKFVENGVNGPPGSNTAVVSLFNKNTSNTTPPEAFSGTGTYTFNTNNLAGMTLNGWTRSVPTIAKGEYLWVRQATATSTSPSDNIDISEWSAAVVLSASGIDGLKAVPIFLYAKNTSTTAPESFTGTAIYNFSTDALAGLTLNGWSRTAPGLGKGEYLWVRQATASSIDTTDTILISEWSTARILSAGGVDGIGTRGAGWWYWDAGAQDLSGVDTTAEVNVFWEAAQGTNFDPVLDDVFVIYTTHPSGTKAFVYNGANWISQAAFVDGNLLVAGTVRSQAIATSAISSDKIEANAVTADKINVINLSAISATLGTFSSAASGERVVIEDDRISVFDASNNLRVRIGRL